MNGRAEEQPTVLTKNDTRLGLRARTGGFVGEIKEIWRYVDGYECVIVVCASGLRMSVPGWDALELLEDTSL